MKERDDEKRWADPKQRKIIEDAAMDSIMKWGGDVKHLNLILYCCENTPWYEWVHSQCAAVLRAKTMFTTYRETIGGFAL